MDFVRKERYGIQDLLKIVHILRAPGGCPWDSAQTHTSIRQNLIEEAYEVVEAIDLADAPLLCEELGDLMLQVALHAEMAAETGAFGFDDVCDGVCQKLIYRHPHVFEGAGELSEGQVLKNWETLKNLEKGRETAADRLDSVPASLPGPMRAAKVQKRAAAYGFTYPDAHAAIADLESELAELKQALAQGRGEAEEIGDVLFSAVNVARLLHCDAEYALTASTNKFAARVKAVAVMAAQAGTPLEDLDAVALDVLWKRAKAAEKQDGSQQREL